MTQEIIVELEERSYPIHFCHDALSEVGPFAEKLTSPTNCVVLSDENVAPLYANQVLESLRNSGFSPHLLTLPAGEEHKNLDVFGDICRQLVDMGLDRTSALFALGGGVVGDIGGFVASTYMRGIAYLQIPTTLLAQVDSSVGGKTAVNLPQGKNLVGAFYQPQGVFIDSNVLSSLDARDVRAGMVEVIKYGIIRDSNFFAWLEDNLEQVLNLDPPSVLHAVRRSCEIKAEVVARDERESGLRAILNYGHTAGHAVENLSEYGRYRHGEAVAIGMEVAGFIATDHLGLSREEQRRQTNILRRVKVPQTIDSLHVDAVIDKMRSDKKSVDGHPTFILADRIGHVEICPNVPINVVRKALAEIGAANDSP